jgi:energy-coupling factor transport system ATP-binding protein
LIKTHDLTFAFPGKPPVLENINLTISAGSHVALTGKNGSGKTSLALILKGLLKPVSGTVEIDGFTTGDEKSRYEIMKRVGMVFQNPDNTIVATTVERELAFGLENLGVLPCEMRERIDVTLKRFGLERYRHTNPTHLSGGEKQCLALAAVMIMKPSHLILDEPTSLLDPWSCDRILQMIHEAASEGATVVHITQSTPEACLADRVLVLDVSRIVEDCPPDKDISKYMIFNPAGIENHVLPKHEVLKETSEIATKQLHEKSARTAEPAVSAIVALDAVTHQYDKGTPFENMALDDITLELREGSSTVLLGPTGSGKTSLLEIAAGVTVPTLGQVRVTGKPVRAMAFQFPEDQMFGDTVESYISFGPRNMGVNESDISNVVSAAFEDVGLDADTYRSRDPYTLSGGEKRRAALAGVLAMKPDVLILDEPTAGLDPDGVRLVVEFLTRYALDGGTLLFSTHDFGVARCLSDFAAVLDRGCIEMYGRVEEVFSESRLIADLKKGRRPV